MRLIPAIFVGALVSWGGLRAEDPAPDFTPPKTVIETAERLLKNEKDPAKRFEILFRWIKIREDYNQTLRSQAVNKEDPALVESFSQTKREIVERLSSELKRFEGKGVNLDRLYRELGFRYLELKRFPESQRSFEALKKRTSEDELSYGDALVHQKLTDQALFAYTIAGADPKLKTMAAYKRGWAYLTLNDFNKALREFDIALEDNPHSPARMREEAFRDRLRPYMETFPATEFLASHAESLRALSLRVKPLPATAKPQDNKLFQDALKYLIEGFNAKSDIQKAEQVYNILVLEVPKDGPEAQLVLIGAAPLWLRMHRGRIEHEAVERILRALPDVAIAVETSTALQAELSNNAAFYETLVSDNKDDDKNADLKAKPILLLTYQKYFVLYPKDAEADPLRINYSRLLLQDGDAESCLKVLNERSRKNPQVESVASGLEAQCELKHLDQLYARPHSDILYANLSSALIEKKIYRRPEIGIPEVQAFKSLVGMLVGSIKKNSSASILRSCLESLTKDFPYPAEADSLRDLKILQAELKFEDLVAAQMDTNEKASQFLKIYEGTPKEAAVALKSLKNSILLTTEKAGLGRCDVFQRDYGQEFTIKSDVFLKCVALAERNLLLEKELSLWKLHEKYLDQSQILRVGLLELGLNQEGRGRARIQGLKTVAASQALDFWYGSQMEKTVLHPKSAELDQLTERFVRGLKEVPFAKIAKVVPVTIEQFKALDKEWLRYSKLDRSKPMALSKVLSQRALMAVRMRDWMKSLPEPAGLTQEELALYRKKAQEVILPWEEQAEAAVRECGQSAYSLSPDFEKVTDCPEQTPEATWNSLMTKWEATRQPDDIASPWAESTKTESRQLFEILYKGGKEEKDALKARYLLIRAYDLAEKSSQKARIQLALAKLVDKDSFWIAANELDGNLIEPILWLKTRSNGNPFYEKLYDSQISLINRREKFIPTKATSSATTSLDRIADE